MSKILVWEPAGSNVGHMALQVSDNLYISFWPKDAYGRDEVRDNKRVASVASTKAMDEAAEGGSCTYDIKIKGKLDAGAIKSWWARFQSTGYTYEHNCCNAVREALRAGKLERNELSQLISEINAIEQSMKETVIRNHTGGWNVPVKKLRPFL